jgi:hypothetical protein
VAAGLAGGVAAGLAGGVAAGLAGDIPGVVAAGVAVGVVVGVAEDKAVGSVLGVALGIIISSFIGYEIYATWELEYGLAACQMAGLVVGLVVGQVIGLSVGLVYRVAVEAVGGVLGGLVLGLSVGVGAGVAGGLADNLTAAAVFGFAFALVIWVTYFRLATYPIDVALAVATYLLSRRHPRAVSRAWRWCPVFWNEVIWLPLPRVGKLLALLVRQDREKGFRAVAFVNAERPLQRRAAADALVEVALDDLAVGSVIELGSAEKRLQWTTAPPAPLPAELMTVLPHFDQAAQKIGQYLTLQNDFRKYEALVRALEEVEALQRLLAAEAGGIAFRFRPTADLWGSILKAEGERFAFHEDTTRDIPNPFIFGNPVTEREANLFTGRRDVVRQIELSILATRAPTLLLYGPRRTGKTSILNQLPRLLGVEFAPAVLDCQNPAVTGSKDVLLRYVARVISAGLKRRRVPSKEPSRDALKLEPFATFDEWLDDVELAMPEPMRILLCLDEYERLDRIMDQGWGGEFLDALRHMLQHRTRLVVMFTGAHTFEEQGPAWTDRFLNARRLRVSFLTREEVIPLLTRPVPDFLLRYTPGALEALLDATRGQPFLTQAVAFELVQFLNEQQRKEATPADVAEAVFRAVASASEYFANVWFDAGPEGQTVLLALARGETPPDFPKARAWLREHDVLNDAGSYAVPMMEQWVKKEKVR